jgi:NarL family two-component system response regulator LiaR
MSLAAARIMAPHRAVVPISAYRPLRVAVRSRHPLTRAGLTHLLSQSGDRTSVAEGPIGAGRLRRHDIVVFDLTDLCRAVRDDFAVLLGDDVPVVALTLSTSPELVEGALAMGAAGIVSMEVTAAGLLESLERASAGHAGEPAAHRRRLGVRTSSQLSERELMVLQLIGTGLTNHDIAARLYLSDNTVKTYIRSAYRKIGVSRRSQAVLWAVRHRSSGPRASTA